MEDYNEIYNKDLYKNIYHDIDISKYSFLVTGGAGFIGSNLVEYLLKNNAKQVRVLDNLSNGYYSNIKNFINLHNFEFINGDICNLEICIESLQNVDFVFHLAALGSVPRSITNPILTNTVNVGGFLNMLEAGRLSKCLIKFIYAASSSTYGDSKISPKKEGTEGKPLSPYAVTKLVNEIYADVYSKVYKFHTIGLRYFNIYGPKQNPDNPYAAVIPIFSNSIINNKAININGDGLISRDFTFVENAIQANIKMLSTSFTQHEVFNVGCGDETTLIEIVRLLEKFSNTKAILNHIKEREGDIKHSKANIDKIRDLANYNPSVRINDGLEITYNWYQKNYEHRS